VVDFAVGSRTKATLQKVISTLLLSNAETIYTDKLNLYSFLIPPYLHINKKYSTNCIERKNLSIRTHLKRLTRRTICYSKSIAMLSACLKIYFWSGNRR
jgi:insertion element IS1 protein InsB